MAKKSTYRPASQNTRSPAVSEEVRRFLSQNGKKGGQRTKELIEAGKEAMGENQ
jgi:hypothetical protein